MATTTKEKPKKKAPTVKVSLSTFDESGRPVYRRLRNRVKLGDFNTIGPEDYNPYGATPLIDATVEFVEDIRALARKGEVQVGLLLDESGSMAPNREAVIASVNTFVDGLRDVKKVDRKTDGKGFLVIATDGYENASRKHTYKDVAKLLGDCEKDGWVVIFLGAGIDAWAQGSTLGLSGGVTGQTVSTVNTPAGTASAFASAAGDGVGYLSDSSTYMKRRAGSTVRSLSEDGKETVMPKTSTSSAVNPQPQAPQAQTFGDPQEALKRASDTLSE